MVTVPVRAAALLFAATVMPKVEGFEVPPPKDIVIQGTSETAVFRQLVGVPDAEMLRLSPAAFAVAELGVKTTAVQVCPYTTGVRHKKRAASTARRGIETLKHCCGAEVSLQTRLSTYKPATTVDLNKISG